jgi:hypothetical protein
MGQQEAIDAPATEKLESPERNRALVKRILTTIKADKRKHEDAFKRMRRNMFVATHGRDESWHEDNYRANIAGRHVKQKTSSLYAKNPKVVAKRRETLDFAVWDENPDSLMLAFQTVQQAMMAQQAAATMPPEIDPMTGQLMPPAAPEPPPGFMEAQAMVEDFQQGMERRKMATKIGKTLEILFSHAMREQKPVDFKTGVKQLVRRACTTGVGYVELGVQREYGPRPGLSEQLADSRQRLEHLRRLSQEAVEGEIDDIDAEAAELEMSLASLQAEEEIVLREGLVFDYPQSTKVIPDQMCQSLVGFIGARHLTVEYLFTANEVAEMFPDADLDGKYTGYTADGKTLGDEGGTTSNIVQDEDEDGAPVEREQKDKGLVCVYKHYDKPSGLVYYVAEGHPEFLRPPAAPDVFVEDFWPVYALTFNAVESEKELFPPSDVELLGPMQAEYNRSRQGMREHRQAARPRWAYANGRLGADDVAKLGSAKPFDVLALEIDGQTKLSDILEPIPVPGVDPNLYGTEQYFTDVQFTVGSSEAQFGGVAKATATESAIAANSSASGDSASIDDLDAFLTVVARAGGQILLKEMSPERVMEIVGPGAVWPEMTLPQIADELFLEVEAGSSGKPNQATELQNWSQMLPFLIQMPGINPMWLAREAIRRLDDRLDLTDAIAAGMPSIVMQNQAKQPGTGDPTTDPAAQGGQGAANGPAPPPDTAGGSGPAFGSNQVDRPV